MHPVTGLSLGFVMGVGLAPFGPVAPWPLAVAALLLVPLVGRGALRLGAAGLLAGLALPHGWPPGPDLRGEVALVGTRVGAATGRSAAVEVARWRHVAGAWHPGEGRVEVRFRDRPPRAGAVVVVQGMASALTPRGLPGAPDRVVAARRVGVRATVAARTVAVIGPEGAPAGPPDDPTGLLRALALGDRSGVDDEATLVLRRTGTSHLLAISGFHVGVMAWMAAAAARRVRCALGVLRPGGVGRWELAVGVAAGAAYAWGAHAPLSAQRAAGVLVLGALGRAAGRRVEAMPLLGLVAVAVLVGDPAAVATPSFQLSFGAVVGLLGLGGPLLAVMPTGRLRWLSTSLAATLAATLGTLPAAAWWFQELPPLSPLANLIAMPITSLVLVPCAAVATVAPEPLATWGDHLGSVGARGMLALLAPLAVEPFRPAVGVGGSAVLWGALAMAPRWPGVAGVLALAALALRPVPVVGTVTFLAVGQGDATLVEHADGRRWLIDGGPAGAGVAAWLRRRGVRRLDRVIATHDQADHAGGLGEVVRTLRVGRVERSDHRGAGVLCHEAVARGVPCEVPRGALHPPAAWEGSPNDRSVVLSALGVLLTGDIEAAAEARLAPRVAAHAVLKVPHHGSATSSSPALLAAVRPEVAVVSVGAGNRFGHPRAEVVDRYARAGVALLRTDRDGTLRMRPSGWSRHRQGWPFWERLVPSADGALDARAELLAGGGPAGPDEEHRDGAGADHQADALREGEHLAEHRLQEPAALDVAAKGLEQRAHQGVERQVEQHHLPVEASVPVEEVREGRDAEQRDGLVDLHRVERHAVGRQRVLRELHREGARARRAVAAARGVAPQSADAVGQRERRGHHVPQGEEGHLPAPHQQEAHREADEEGAVEHQAAAADVQDVEGPVDRLRVLRDEDQARPEQRQDREPEDQVGHALQRHPDASGPHEHDGRSHQEGDAAEEAVGVDLEATDVEQDGMHGPRLTAR